jgi:hypothetical protein
MYPANTPDILSTPQHRRFALFPVGWQNSQVIIPLDEFTITVVSPSKGENIQMTHKRSSFALAYLFLTSILVFGVSLAHGQEQSTDSTIASLRADIGADKVAIITDAMKFNDKDAAAFWPIYKKYAYDQSTVNDKRVEIIKEYADKYSTMTDQDAKEMAGKMFDFQSQRVDLEKKYFKEFSKVLPARTVVRFFQLENRLDLIVDLQLASNLPPVLAGSGNTQ